MPVERSRARAMPAASTSAPPQISTPWRARVSAGERRSRGGARRRWRGGGDAVDAGGGLARDAQDAAALRVRQQHRQTIFVLACEACTFQAKGVARQIGKAGQGGNSLLVPAAQQRGALAW